MATRLMRIYHLPARGFSLVELAIVLLVLGILARTAIVPLTGAVESRQRRTAVTQLNAIRTSVVAHVVAKGALPCPLVLNTALVASRPSSTNLSTNLVDSLSSDAWMNRTALPVCDLSQGAVPADVLGLAGSTNELGALLDPWNRPYRMAISLNSHPDHGTQNLPDWTSPGEAARVGLKSLRADILVCSRSQGDNCSARDVRTHEIASLVWSLGKDASELGAQRENLDGDDVFVWQEASMVPEHLFDDHMVWVSAADVMYWMLRAGWLP